MSRPINRRTFLKETSGAGMAIGAGVAARARTARSAPQRGANDRIRLGLIGVGPMGIHHLGELKHMPRADVVVLCDCHRGRLPVGQKKYNRPVETCQDFRAVLDRRDIDAVIIAAPDHWHGLMGILACQAGKDVYVEKPLCLTVAEGRALVQHARKHKRVVQVGTQQRSGEHIRRAVELVRNGDLGTVTLAKAWNVGNRLPGFGFPPDEDPPAELDWDMYCGPSPKRPFNKLRWGGTFRHFRDYSGGTLTDWGVHHFDTIREMMGALAPKRISAYGGKFAIDDAAETPDTLNVVYDFDGWTLEYELREACSHSPWPCVGYGIALFGSRQTMFLDRNGYRLYPDPVKVKDGKKIVVGEPGRLELVPKYLHVPHLNNFFDCMASRKEPNADVEIGHRSTAIAHLGNIALDTGRQILWNAQRETIVNDPEAQKLLSRSYRSPWSLPKA